MDRVERFLSTLLIVSQMKEASEWVVYKSTLKRMQQLLILNATLLWQLGPWILSHETVFKCRASGGCFIAKFRNFRWNCREAHSTSRPPAVLDVPNSAWKGLQPFLLNSPILQKRHLFKLSSICPVILPCDRSFRTLSKVSMMFNSLINIYLVKMDVFIGIWDFSLRLIMLKDLDFQVGVWFYAWGKTATSKHHMKKIIWNKFWKSII